MGPEQAANGPVDGRSDIYSLGVVGYVAVSGRLPFETTNLPALLVRQATETPASVMRAAPGLPPALGAAIDRCLARDRAERFVDGEALAAALVPAVETRPALPATLRAWLGTHNPATPVYLAASGVLSFATLMNIIYMVQQAGSKHLWQVALLAGLAVTPWVPMIGFHLKQAHRLFRAGHTLADLRTALDTADRERSEAKALAAEEREKPAARVLRVATYTAASWGAVMFYLLVTGWVTENTIGVAPFLLPFFGTLVLGATCNVLEVPLIPECVQQADQAGLRDWLWRSKLGGWLARRLGAPERSGLTGASAFRATEAALGVAASELFAALPKAYREQLADLPAIVVALEARAAEARAEVDVLAALVPSGSVDADVLAARRDAAAARLSESVAALEAVRLDLLRLHAGAGDLAPLTTLIDAARLMGEDMSRLAEAQREGRGASLD